MSRRSIGEGTSDLLWLLRETDRGGGREGGRGGQREKGGTAAYSRCNLQLLFSTSDFIFSLVERRGSRRSTVDSKCNDLRREIAFCNKGCVRSR